MRASTSSLSPHPGVAYLLSRVAELTLSGTGHILLGDRQRENEAKGLKVALDVKIKRAARPAGREGPSALRTSLPRHSLPPFLQMAAAK